MLFLLSFENFPRYLPCAVPHFFFRAALQKFYSRSTCGNGSESVAELHDGILNAVCFTFPAPHDENNPFPLSESAAIMRHINHFRVSNFHVTTKS